MRKILKISGLLLVIVLVTGCGGSKEKVLTCTSSNKEAGMEIVEELNITFKSKKAVKLKKIEKLVLDDDYKTYIKQFADAASNQYASYKNEKGITYKVDTKDNKVIITFDADFSKLSKELKKELIFDSSNDFSSTKKSLEENGFKCK